LTALSDSYDAERKDGVLVVYKVAGGAAIYKGAMVALDASGFAIPAADASGLLFVGYAYENADNAEGDDGDVSVRVWKDGSFLAAKASAAQGDLGKAAYVVDDNTVALSATHSVLAGTIVEVPASDTVRVLIRNAVK